MEADETKKQGRRTHSVLQVCTQVQGHEATLLAFSAITQNKTPLNLLPTKIFDYLVFRNVQNFIHTKFLHIWYLIIK